MLDRCLYMLWLVQTLPRCHQRTPTGRHRSLDGLKLNRIGTRAPTATSCSCGDLYDMCLMMIRWIPVTGMI
jgi:hypothetical protein